MIETSPPDRGRVTLRFLAERLGLSPAAISLVLNQAPGAAAIPPATQARIFSEARRFEYQPNSVARSLRHRRTFTVGVMVPDATDPCAALVVSGVEEYLLQAGYLYYVASHRGRADLIDRYPRLMLARAVEGLIVVDTPCPRPLGVPLVSISGHERARGVTVVSLDHERAATLALRHLHALGHQRIAVIDGPSPATGTDPRRRAIETAAARLEMPIDPALVAQLDADPRGPEPAERATRDLLARRVRFTAVVVASHDVTAFGAIRALHAAGLRVPDDVSVVGMDDVEVAAYQQPALTTVRRPLRRMGEIASETLLRRISEPEAKHSRQIDVLPELVVRDSTGMVSG